MDDYKKLTNEVGAPVAVTEGGDMQRHITPLFLQPVITGRQLMLH